MRKNPAKSVTSPAPVEVVSSNRAEEINRLHQEIWTGMRTNVEHAIRIGELLVAQKNDCAHGDWLPWLEDNVRFSQKTASRYMRCFENREELNYSGTPNFTIEEAARLLCDNDRADPKFHNRSACEITDTA